MKDLRIGARLRCGTTPRSSLRSERNFCEFGIFGVGYVRVWLNFVLRRAHIVLRERESEKRKAK